MRVLLALAIVLHLSGVPAVAASPCAAGGESAHGCCFLHHTVTGGRAIGACGCKTPAAPSASADGVATGPGSSEKAGARSLILAAPGTIAALGVAQPLADASTLRASTGPPSLTVLGLRC